MYPADAFEAVAVPPILGWYPVTGADHYYVEVATDPDFNALVDQAHPLFINKLCSRAGSDNQFAVRYILVASSSTRFYKKSSWRME